MTRPRDDRRPTSTCATASRSRSTSPTSTEASQLAREVAPWFGVAKVGLELYSAAGPDAIDPHPRRSASRVFCDLKLHDIPTTVGRAARVLGRLGVSLPELPRRGWCRHAARRRRRPRRGRARRGARGARSRSRSRC